MWGVLLVAFWTACSNLMKKLNKVWSVINLVVWIGVILFIISWTLFRTSSKRAVRIIPFSSFVVARSSPEIYRSVVANFLLFIPYGMTLPFVIDFVYKKRFRHQARITIITASVFSACIEICQYMLTIGLCETDDVIFNTLGAAVGTLSFMLFVYIVRRA